MSTSSRAQGKWQGLLLAAAPGLLIVLATWSSATSAAARFFLGILVGLSIALLVAGLAAWVDRTDGGSGQGHGLDHP